MRTGNEAVSDAEWIRPDQKFRTTVAKPGYAPNLRVEEERKRTQSVTQTDRCYCEPVWWEKLPRSKDESEMTAQSNRCRNREG
jgi:hypothetical protein